MIIILKKVSPKTQLEDVIDFLAPAVYGHWLNKRGRIEKILTLVQRNVWTHVVRHHVLVDISPDFVAKRVIKALNKQYLAGKYIAVSEYKVRTWHNDGRINHSYAHVRKHNNNKRANGRRNEYEDFISEISASKYDKA
ncbi:MAG: hypothetical protein WCK96_06915 [Methylococcales bacterium]